LTDRFTLGEGAQLIDARQGCSRNLQVLVASTSAKYQPVVVEHRVVFELQSTGGSIHMLHSGIGAQLNVVLLIPISRLHNPVAEVFFTPQVRFGERWTPKGDGRL